MRVCCCFLQMAREAAERSQRGLQKRIAEAELPEENHNGCKAAKACNSQQRGGGGAPRFPSPQAVSATALPAARDTAGWAWMRPSMSLTPECSAQNG